MQNGNTAIPRDTAETLLKYQRNEITEHLIYGRLAAAEKNAENAEVLRAIAADELRHYEFWKKHTGRDIAPSRLRVYFYYWIARVLGLTFGIKLMERGEEAAQKKYGAIESAVPGAAAIARDEEVHEKKLIGMLDEEKLRYVGPSSWG